MHWHSNRRSDLAAIGSVALLALLVGCGSSPDLPTWRSGIQPRHPSQQGELADELAEIDALREGFDLVGSRERVVRIVAERPLNGEALWRAARAEFDSVFATPKDNRETRDMSAWSALDYAERAAEVRPDDPEVLGQLAWALGSSTHLQGMFSRAGHATRTLEAVERALEVDPEQVTALATLATLRLRLATLPWIAKVMAFGAPDGDLEEAEELARRCVAQRPSVEHRLLLAKCLLALENPGQARAVLESAIAGEPEYPRDRVLGDTARAMLDELSD